MQIKPNVSPPKNHRYTLLFYTFSVHFVKIKENLVRSYDFAKRKRIGAEQSRNKLQNRFKAA